MFRKIFIQLMFVFLFALSCLAQGKSDRTSDKQAANIYGFEPKMASASISFQMTEVNPKVFTPNGDNRNDFVTFRFENPYDSNPFGKILSLNGVLVAEMQKGSEFNTFVWDGRTLEGSIAGPGPYIYQIEVTGSETKIINGVIVVAK